MRKVIFEGTDWDITLRELIASLVIIAVLFILGIIISEHISANESNYNLILEQSAQITDPDLFKYGMNTNIGNAFVFGDYEAINPVTFEGVDGLYSEITQTHQEYRRHTRTVTETYTENGKTKTRTRQEKYWTWDYVGSDTRKVDKIIFCGSEFDYELIKLPDTQHITTIKTGYHKRDVYAGKKSKYNGTIYTELRNGTITKTTLLETDIENAMEHMKKHGGIIVFWILWVCLIIGSVFGFYYIDNKWLE